MFKSFLKSFTKEVEKQIEIQTEFLKDEVDNQTPEFSKRLLKHNKIEITNEGGIVKGEVSNKTPYAKYVEYGVGGKQYNYHKPKGKTFYSGVGARMFTKTIDNNEADIIKSLKKKLG